MVERYTLTSLDEVADTFGVAPPPGSAPRFNIAPLQIALIRTARAIVAARWGLLPPWRGHGGKRGPHVVHAPLDAIDQVPLLRNAFKSQRCLVIADGWFVWQRTAKKSLPVWMHLPGDPARPHRRSRLIAFAGLAATHRDDDQPSFAIIAGRAPPTGSALVGPVDPELPIVIAGADHDAWLGGPRERARALLAPASIAWRADAVSTWVNSIDHDDARCVEPLGNPAQGELF
jgi:putative SOS response-associated peptidase YedK